MSPTTHVQSVRLAPALNESCQCIWLDRAELQRQLDRRFGDPRLSLETSPGLVSGRVIFIDAQDAAAMDRTTALAHRALTSRAFRSHVETHAPPIAQRACPASGGILGLDFHLGGEVPQLIEINTNPGGLLINLELARAVTACCGALIEPLPQMTSDRIALGDLPAQITANFQAEWTSMRGTASLGTIALADDDPEHQYLYPEFLLYQRLFEQARWRALIVDAASLEARDDGLFAGDQKIDLVYNRVTDFYLADQRHAALRRAYEGDLAVVTPHPAAHARWADKRLLAWLRDETLLRQAGLDDAECAHLRASIPPTEIVSAEHGNELWRRRKELFFKPIDGFGGKAAYRGDKLTRSTFEHILAHRYVAQALAPTSMRRVVVDGEPKDLRVDVRNFGSNGSTWLRAARLYRGQTTNFRTPGGGFAPVLTLPPAGG